MTDSFLLFLALLLIVGIFVLQARGGKIFNHLFMGSKIASKRAEMRRELHWTSPESAVAVISAIRQELALSTASRLAAKTYSEVGSTPTRVVIAYGNKVAEAFRCQISAVDNADGHAGKFEVTNFLEADSMPIDADKLVALRNKVASLVRSRGASVS